MHFAAFLDVGESVREPAGYYRNNVVRRAGRARGDGGRVGAALRLLVDLRDLRRADRDADRRRRIRSGRSTATARRSWRSSGRCRTSSGRYGMRSVALRYFNAAGADPDGEIGEDHSPEIHLIPRAIDAATGARAFRCSATTTRRRTAPACATTSTSPIWPTRTCGRSRRLRDGGAVGRLQSRHRPSAFGARGDRRGRAGDRAAGAVDAGAAAAGRSGGAVCRAAARRRPSCDWTPRFADLDVIVRDRLALAPRASARVREPTAHP